MLRWNNLPVRTILESHLHLPISLQHHSASLALAESWFGAATADDLLCIDLGESVNLGILIDGQVFRDGAGTAANFAHVSLDPNGPPCPCGNRGCVDTYCAAPGVLASARQSATPSGPNAPAATIAELAALAVSGSAPARAAFDRMGRHLALGINTLIQLFDPALIVLAGTSTFAADFFRPALERQLANHNPCRKLLISQLGPRAAALGACAAVLQSIFTPDA
jgi:glucokinase